MDQVLNGFKCENLSKLNRAAEAVGSNDDAALLAEYDRIGGYITKNGEKVKTGSFYDFKAKAARKKPQIVFIYSVNGSLVEVPEGAELPGEVRAAKILEGVAKKKGKKGKKVADENESDDTDGEEGEDAE